MRYNEIQMRTTTLVIDFDRGKEIVKKINSYILMHKNIKVLDIEIYSDERRTDIEKVGEVYNIAHMPIGTLDDNGMPDHYKVESWLFSRAIPASRDGITRVLGSLREHGINSTAHLIERCLALSLSDQYWICPKGESLKWESINFFENAFSDDMGKLLLGEDIKTQKNINLASPNNTLDGFLKKKWIIVDEKRILMKGGSGVFEQEPLNEVVASSIMKRLQIDHISYSLSFKDETPYSLCENFISPNTELIPAWCIMEKLPRGEETADFRHFLSCCEKLGVENAETFIGKMLAVDYLISNEDRHLGNFGIIRNADTLKIEGFAPIFDNGNSLWYATPKVGSQRECKPFKLTHAEQIKLVADFSWFDGSSLGGIKQEIADIFSQSTIFPHSRAEEIGSCVLEKIKDIQNLQSKKIY